MGKSGIRLRGNEGYSLLEVIIGGVLLAVIALALLPAMLSLNSSLKLNAFQAQCNAIVRAKLQEYANGVGTVGASNYIPSGFEYTRSRFYLYANAGESTPSGTAYKYCQNPPLKGYPGYREMINKNTKQPNTYVGYDDPLSPDIPDRLQGFQLYVNIRHYNPRGDGSSNSIPRRQCPSGTTYTTPNNYQFYRLGDGLEVVVTGMIRTNPTLANGGRGGKAWGPYKDVDDDTPNPRLVCSASQIIYPPRLPFRYYLGDDGKLRNYQATLAYTSGSPGSNLEALEAHFRSIWSQNATSTGTINSSTIANIRSIAVSPENNMVYVLRPGELTLYKTCSDQTVTMTKPSPSTTTVEFEKTPNCSLGAANVTTWWPLDGNIENIAVDFKKFSDETDDRVYALYNTGGNAAGDIRQLSLTAGGGSGSVSVIAPTDSGMSNFKLPLNKPRIRGIFLAQTFPSVNAPNIFYFDNSCNNSDAASASLFNYCVGIFNSADTKMNLPVREMPVQVQSISY